VRNRFLRYSDGLQSNWGARNYIGANTFEGNAFGISLTGAGNMVEGNTIRGNGIGVAVRPEAKVAVNRISQNSISGNGLPIMRCSAGGSCDPKLPRGGIVIGPPGLEHGSFVGSRGMGVVFDKAGAAVICLNQDDPAGCHPQPQFGLGPPKLSAVRAVGGKLSVSGALQGPPASLVTVEVFAGKSGTAEGERYLGAIQAVTDGVGDAAFAGEVDGAAVGAAITATTTTAAGASSAFSKAVAAGR